MAKRDKPKVTSRKHIARLERERQLNKSLVVGTFVVVALVLGLVTWSAIRDTVIYPRLTVATVEGEAIHGRDFQLRVRLNRQQLINQYTQYYQTAQLFASDPTFQQQIYNQLLQIVFQLDPQTVGNTTINQLVDDHLIIKEAQSRGIEVSDDQIEEAVQHFLSYYPDGTPTPTVGPTQPPTSTLSATQYALVSPTPTYTPPPTATATQPVLPTPTATEGPTATQGPTATNDPNATPLPTTGPTATATAYTFEGYQQRLQDYISSQSDAIGLNEDALRALLRVNLYRQKLFAEVTADVVRVQDQVWARHILVDNEDTANEVLDQLNRGEDWAALAADFSLDTANKDNGGDLGWFTHDTMVQDFADAAFAMDVGEISGPVQSSAGWHIIQVLGHEERALTDQEFEQAKQSAFQDFVTGLRDKYQWEIFDNWQNMTPEDPTIPPQLQLGQ